MSKHADTEELRGLANTALIAGANSWADRRLLAALDPGAVIRICDEIDELRDKTFAPDTGAVKLLLSPGAFSAPKGQEAAAQELPDESEPAPQWRTNPHCAEAWPGCWDGGYDPSCCRWPKSCSCLELATGAADVPPPASAPVVAAEPPEPVVVETAGNSNLSSQEPACTATRAARWGRGVQGTYHKCTLAAGHTGEHRSASGRL